MLGLLGETQVFNLCAMQPPPPPPPPVGNFALEEQVKFELREFDTKNLGISW